MMVYFNFPARLKITKDNVVLIIEDVPITNTFMSIPYVQETTLRSSGYPMISKNGGSVSIGSVDVIGKNLTFYSTYRNVLLKQGKFCN